MGDLPSTPLHLLLLLLQLGLLRLPLLQANKLGIKDVTLGIAMNCSTTIQRNTTGQTRMNI